MIRAEPTSAACSACGKEDERGAAALTIGETTAVLCQECGNYAATAIQDKLSLHGALEHRSARRRRAPDRDGAAGAPG